MRPGFVIAAAFLGFLALARPASAFEGSIRYRLTDKKHAVHEVTLTESGTRMRVESAMQSGTFAFIVDSATRTITTLIPDRKSYSVSTYNPSAAAPKRPGERMRKTGATDTVAGYPVQEWALEEGGRTKASLWITDQLGKGFAMPSSGATGRFAVPAELRDKGMPLRIVTATETMEALKVEVGSPSASEFRVPKGYTKLAGAPGFSGAGGTMPPEAQARLRKAMESMTPQQRAAMEQMLKGQEAPAGGQ